MAKITQEDVATMNEIMRGASRQHDIANEIRSGKRQWQGGEVDAQAARELDAEDRRKRT